MKSAMVTVGAEHQHSEGLHFLVCVSTCMKRAVHQTNWVGFHALGAS